MKLFYYDHNDVGDLEGMISAHMDDSTLAGTIEFLEIITRVVKKMCDISKLEDRDFRYSSIDVKSKNGGIELSMDDYAKV